MNELDVREVPRYTIAEAARYLKLAPATLRSWVKGRPYPRRGGPGYFEPLIQPPHPHEPRLSFSNLIEAHVLRALRVEHDVAMRKVREALRESQSKLGIDRLLLRRELTTSGGELFLEIYGDLLSLSKSGQYALKKVLESHLSRVEYDLSDWAARLYPFAHQESEARVIAIDPYLAFGRPIVARRGISTAAIIDRIDAGEQPDEVAKDYDLRIDEIDEALVYEHRLAA